MAVRDVTATSSKRLPNFANETYAKAAIAGDECVAVRPDACVEKDAPRDDDDGGDAA